jgi:hypothetical protein
MSSFSLVELFGKLKQLFRDVKILSGNETTTTLNIVRDEAKINNIHIENITIAINADSSGEGVPKLDVKRGTLEIPSSAENKDDIAKIVYDAFSSADKGSTVSRKDVFSMRREYYGYRDTAGSLELLEFYKDLVLSEDVRILRASRSSFVISRLVARVCAGLNVTSLIGTVIAGGTSAIW